jgi:uncharacterized membrane protein YgdD (TMEM256/DUF423 family)
MSERAVVMMFVVAVVLVLAVFALFAVNAVNKGIFASVNATIRTPYPNPSGLSTSVAYMLIAATAIMVIILIIIVVLRLFRGLK